jgi:hypothetical protein
MKLNDKSVNFTKEDVFDVYPALKIEKVIFGYNISNEMKHKISRVLNALTITKLGYRIGINNSIFTSYFNEINK